MFNFSSYLSCRSLRGYRLCISFFSFLSLFCLSHCQPQNTLPAPDPENGGLYLPEGFEAVVVVDSLQGAARHLAVRDNGDIFVKLRFVQDDGGNAALRDTNGDGKADIIQRFGTYENDGNYGTAMKIRKEYVYYSSQSRVFRQKLEGDALVPSSEMELVLDDDFPNRRREHMAKPISFDDKGYMYVPFGAPSNCCQDPKRTPGQPGLDPCPQLEQHAGIWRFEEGKTNLTRKDGERFATGIRSIVGMDWNQQDDQLYAVVHGRDDLLRLFADRFSPWESAMFPSEEFIRVTEDSDFGWPYCYYDQLQKKKVLNPEYGGDGTKVGRCGTFMLPEMGFPGHWAPNELHFYQGDQFPERYRNGAFIAFHGSTNRTPYPQSGYFIGFVPFENGRISGTWEIFADGFAGIDTIENTRDAHYRPMGIATGPDGSLYVSDTEKGKIWRIMYTGKKEDFVEASLAGMEERKMLSHIKTPDILEDNLQKDVNIAGADIYNTYCGTCHQRNGKGDGSRFPSLVNEEWVGGDKQRLISLVLNGMEGEIKVNGQTYNNLMPQHSFLKDDEIARVLTYVRQNFGNDYGSITAEEVTQVRNQQPRP
jgi:glucose/arabinose dehydrogenase